ncbi:MAG: Nif11 domain, partial [Cyanobacteriota bacterium]
MSIENAQSFYVRVSSDKEFRTQLEQTETVEERQQIIQTAGYEFTAE